MKLPSWFKNIQTLIGTLTLDRNALSVFVLTILTVPVFGSFALWSINLYVFFKAYREKKWLPILLIYLLFELSATDIFTDSFVFKIIRFPIMAVLLVTGFYKSTKEHNILKTILVIVLAVILVSSIFNSQFTSISTLKAISFGLLSIGSFSLFSYLRRLGLFDIAISAINTFFIFNIILSSIIFFTDYARVVSSLFNGSYGDPQSAGPFYSISIVWLIYHYLMQNRKDRRVLILAALALFFLYLTKSRNSMLSLVLGGTLAYILSFLNKIPVPNRKRFWGIIGSVVFLLFLGFITEPDGFVLAAQEYIQKGDQSTTATELFQLTRGDLIEASMANFYEHPIGGIGFGISTDYQNDWMVRIQQKGGFLSGASVEKGFLPSAVLEEQGLIGALLLLIIIVHVTTRLIRKRSFMLLWLFFSTFFINFGEAALYSMGPLGLLMWIIIAYVYCVPTLTNKISLINHVTK